MIEALLADGADEPLGVRVRTRRTDPSADGLDTDRGEHLVEGGGELGVPVADEESESPAGIFQVRGEWRATCVIHGPFGLVVAPRTWTTASLQLDHEQHVAAAEEHSVDMEEVGG